MERQHSRACLRRTAGRGVRMGDCAEWLSPRERGRGVVIRKITLACLSFSASCNPFGTSHGRPCYVESLALAILLFVKASRFIFSSMPLRPSH